MLLCQISLSNVQNSLKETLDYFYEKLSQVKKFDFIEKLWQYFPGENRRNEALNRYPLNPYHLWHTMMFALMCRTETRFKIVKRAT